MGRISRGWKLTKMSFWVIKKDKEILIFPLLSMISLGIIAASFIGGIFLIGGFNAFTSPPGILALITMYLLLYFFGVYFNVAMIGCAMIRFEGGDTTVSDGFKTSNQNLGAILKWAMVSGTVGIILMIIQSRTKLAGRILASIAGVAWSVATYFAVPVLIFEESSVFGAVKRSAHLLKSTWGEMIVGGLGIGLIFFLLALPGILPLLIGFWLAGISGLIIGLIISIIYWLFIAIISTAVSAIFHTALYRYAVTGKTAPGFPGELIGKPWEEKPEKESEWQKKEESWRKESDSEEWRE